MKLVIHTDGSAVRGSENQLILLAGALMRRGWEVVVAGRARTPAGDAFRAIGARTTNIRPRGDVDAVSLARFTAWLRRERPDALLLASWKRFPSAAAAGRVARVPRSVLRVGVQQPIPRDGVSGWKYRRAFEGGIDAVVANASGLGAHLREELPHLAPRIHVVRNGMAPHRAAPGPLRAEIGAAKGDVVFLTAGGLERRKGFDLLVAALARTGRSDIRVAIAGEGPLEGELRALADVCGVADRVHLLGQRRDLPALLAAADAFVLPSRRDSLANAMLEAMAAGLPVISTDVHGADDALAPAEGRGPAGWIVPRGDDAALARALCDVADGVRAGSPEMRLRGDEARWRVENWFSVESMVDGYEAVLRQ